jgi:predicted transposase YdaD
LLCDLSGTSPEEVVTRLESRIEREAQIEERRKLWASTYLLAGVRYAPEIAGKLLERAVAQMKESMTYQKILADGREEGMQAGMHAGMQAGMQAGRQTGRVEGERALFLKFARRRLGEPNEKTLAIIQEASPEKIEFWMEEILKAESWSELIGE